jgi:large repetitive protein
VTNTVTCTAMLTLVKQISNPFPGLPSAPLDSWTLTASTASAVLFSGTTPVSGAVPASTTITMSESHVPGYQQVTDPGVVLAPGATGSWDCQDTPPAGPDGIEDFGGQDGTVILGFGEIATCTAVNQPVTATLTLVKDVANNRGGTAVPADWTLTASPDTVTSPPLPGLSGPAGSGPVTGVQIPAGIGYTLGESGPAGYSLTSLSCAASGTQVPLRDGVLTAAAGQDVTCTFINTQAGVPVTG